MVNFIIIGILIIIVGGAIIYIVKEKKKGTKCIGCPVSGCCNKNGCK
ncbi:MAG: FeoB-associated Cys-rich membrane protein [Lachnospiraceae bacterium]